MIEDAAELMGSRWKNGKRTGTMGVYSAFSFHGSKTMTTGEGGMFATNDDRLAHTVTALNAHGRMPGETKQFWARDHREDKDNDVEHPSCARAARNSSRVEELIARRREIDARLASAPRFRGNLPRRSIQSRGQRQTRYRMPTIVANPATCPSIATRCSTTCARTTSTRASSSGPVAQHATDVEDKPENKVSYSASLQARDQSSDSYHDLREDEIDRVCEIIRRHI